MFRLVLITLLRVGFAWLLAGALGFTTAHAQDTDSGLPWKRSGSIMLALSGASAGLAAGLLASQEPDSFAGGVGLGHAAISLGYAVDGTLRLVNMGRARHMQRPRASGRASVVAPINIAVNGLVTVGGALLLALHDEPALRGAGFTWLVHGAWLTTFCVVQFVKLRRGRRPWMAVAGNGLRF